MQPERKPEGLRKTADQVLSEPRHRKRAEKLRRQIKAAGGAARAAELIELRRR